MNRLFKDQSGIGMLVVLLVVMALAGIGAAGYAVYKNRHKDAVSTINAANNRSTAAIQSPAPTAGWTSYMSRLGKFSLDYPKAWVTTPNPDQCSNTAQTGIFMLAPTAASVGTCASEGAGEVTVAWRSDRQFCGNLNSDTWTQNSKGTVTVAGVSATEITATAKAPGPGLGAEPEGTKNIQYCLVANNMTYIADYNQQPSYPDVSSIFNLMITRTFKVN